MRAGLFADMFFSGMPTRSPVSQEYKIVAFNRPLQWTRSDDEIWMLNPPRRYIFNTNQLQSEALAPYIDSISDLKSARFYNALRVPGNQLRGARILVERFRDRGIGDLLFMSGPLSFLQHLTGGRAHIDLYGLTDRAVILRYHPAIAYEGILAGPILYTDLPEYQYHWFVDSVTEHDETKEQLNVYDALYRQLGLDPAKVDPRFKRPSIRLVNEDYENLDSLYHMVARERGIDLRVTPYYVLAPSAVSSLRVAPYSMWLRLAQELAKVRPVIFVGNVTGEQQMPSAGMTFGQFYSAAGNLGPRVLNLMGNTSIRVVAALISKAVAAVTLDSGLLYVAQALNTPAISLWGTHAPSSRIGYDPAYMRNAIFKKNACPASPCYAYAGFPHTKCVRGASQVLCEPLNQVEPAEIITKMTEIESEINAGQTLKMVAPEASPAPAGP